MLKIILYLFYDLLPSIRGQFWGLFLKGTHKKLQIGWNCHLLNPSKIHIGDNVFLGFGSDIQAYEEHIFIGNDVMIAPNNSFIGTNHIFNDLNIPMRLQGSKSKKIIVEDDVWVGTRCVILAGVTLGKGSVVGSGAVVTKDVPPYAVIGGVPAKIIKYRK